MFKLAPCTSIGDCVLEVNEEESYRSFRRMLSRILWVRNVSKNLRVTVVQQRHSQEKELGKSLTSYWIYEAF
jgi:hypothetical protein